MNTNQPENTFFNRRFFKTAFFIGLLLTLAFSGVPANLVDTTSTVVLAQTAVTGEWSADFKRDEPDKIYLNLNRRRKNGNSNFGSTTDFNDLQGLSREQAANAAKSVVKFRLVREAGTIDFEGSFQNGKGAGQFVFTPDQNFVAALRSQGFQDELDEEKFFAAAMLKVSLKTIDDLRAAGFQKLTLEDVFKAAIFRITPEYITELRSLGYDNLDFEELVKGRIFKISAEFARQVQEMGFGRQPMESLVKMRIFKITPEFLREIRATGLENLSIEDLVKFKIHRVDGDFINRARANGYTGSDPEEFVRLRIHRIVK